MKMLTWIATSAMAFAAHASDPTPAERSRPFDAYTWVTTHNAFTSNGLVPNQRQTMAQQLDAGVRALMLDLHEHQGRVKLCHNRCVGQDTETLAHFLNATLLPFLNANPSAIVTLHLEDFSNRRALRNELSRAPGLVQLAFDPYAWQTATWPTYQDMLDAGQRVLIFTLNRANSGTVLTDAGGVHLMPSEDFTVENYWSLGVTPWTHDRSCRSRWGENVRPLRTAEITGKPGWRPLFTMNHFHGTLAPLFEHHARHDNTFEELTSRFMHHCLPVAGRKPNYLAVDFHETGDTAAVARWMTQLDR
jgi:hypothetical protein